MRLDQRWSPTLPRPLRGRPLKTTYEGLTLDRFQREAMGAIEAGEDVVVAAPTGAGKTLIAHFAIEKALAEGKRAIYTAPIKALSNQKYRDLQARFPGKVGIATGDVSIDADAPVVIMTTEIFRNTIFEDPARVRETGWVIFDEVHYLDDPERGTVWEESLIFAPKGIRVLALSATVSNLDEFAAWMREARDCKVRVVLENTRPVPLEVFVVSTEGGKVEPLERIGSLRLSRSAYQARGRLRGRDARVYYERAQEALVERVLERDELPLLFFLFSRAGCERLAVACMKDDFMPSADAARAATADFDKLAARFDLDPKNPDVRQLRALVARGIAYHHAGVLPPLKEVIERLFTSGHLKLLCATETFALGVNMPARSVAFEGVMRWNGQARVPLKTREYQQMAGRAGRRGIDEQGSVYLLYDPGRDDRRQVEGIVHGKVEPVESQFNLSYGTLLNLYQRLGEEIYDACERSFANFRARQSITQRHGRQRGRRDKGAIEHPLRNKRGHSPRGGRRTAYGRGRRGRRAEQRHEHAPPPRAAGYAGIVEQVRIKLGILAELGYIDAQGQVTERGRFAMAVFGHDLEIAELVGSGALDGLDPGAIAVVLAAVVFESRKGVFYAGDPKRLVGKRAYRDAQRALGQLVALEEARGVRAPSKLLDWNLSGVVAAWVDGAELRDLEGLTDAAAGDIIRSLRQTIQALRLTKKPLRAVLNRADLAHRVGEAQGLLKRGLVDAEWQLRRSADLEEGEEAEPLEGPPPEEPRPPRTAQDPQPGPGSKPASPGPSADEDWARGFSEGIL